MIKGCEKVLNMKRLLIVFMLCVLGKSISAQSVALPQLNLSTSAIYDNWNLGTDTFFVLEVSLDSHLPFSDFSFNLTYDPSVLTPLTTGLDQINTDTYITSNFSGAIDLSMSNGGSITATEYTVSGLQNMLTIEFSGNQASQTLFNTCNGTLIYVAFKKANPCYDAPIAIEFWNGDDAGTYINPSQTHACSIIDSTTNYSTELGSLLAIDGQVILNFLQSSIAQNGVLLEATALGGTPPYSYEWQDENGDVVSNAASFSPSSNQEYLLILTDANGCFSMGSYLFQSVATNDKAVMETSLYPNPSNGQFFIREKGNYNYTIINTSGQILQQGEGIGFQKAHFENQAEGLYFVIISSEGKNRIQKLYIK